jgi:hypothetical protein
MTTQDYGTVEYNGKTLTITQQPYIDTYFADGDQRAMYFATAEDGENEYEIRWEIINEETEDESEACDWDIFRVRLLGTKI